VADRLSIEKFRRVENLQDETDWEDQLVDWSYEGISPALCSEGCEVESDGSCEHGHPSVLLEAGVL
jgi:hypothetical protein